MLYIINIIKVIGTNILVGKFNILSPGQFNAAKQTRKKTIGRTGPGWVGLGYAGHMLYMVLKPEPVF
jgi:hypothetical protein